MAKKSKSKSPNSSTDQTKPKSVFKSIFGDAPDEQGSIFSASNPFLAKPSQESVAGDVKVDSKSTHKRKTDEDAMPGDGFDLGGVKKGKKLSRDEKGEIFEGKNGELSVVEKRKSGKKGDSGVELEGKVAIFSEEGTVKDEGNDGLVVKSEGSKEKKKKRKRDEVEAENEEKRYGVRDESVEEVGKGVGVGEKRKKMEEPEETLVPREGFDDEEKLLRTVFVGNLPLKIKKKVLLREFGQFGEIESVRIRSVPLLDDKTPRKGAILKKRVNDAVDRVNAYIVFKKEESAQASLSHNMAVVGGNHIHVDRACPPRKKLKGENAPLYDHKRTVFVGNLPFNVKDEDLYQLFSGIRDLKSSIEAVRVVRDPGTSLGKGIAYVLFKTREAANMVVKKNLKILDRELRLYHAKPNPTAKQNSTAKPNSTPSKRKGSFSADKYHSPSKKLSVGTPSSGSGTKRKDLSYQGVRASKSGSEKGVRKFNNPRKSGSHKAPNQKERSEKRPSVAARKAAANGQSSGGPPQTGKKRKQESRTPQSKNRNKKARTFR